MYGKEEFQQLKKDFWSQLEEKLNEKKNPHGSKVKWLNYNTKIKNLYFRMEADEVGARLCIDLQFRDESIREVLWDQFLEFETKLNDLFEQELIWNQEYHHENGLTISRISIRLEGKSMLNKKDWPEIHQFLTLNFTRLNKFWFEYADLFKSLMN